MQHTAKASRAQSSGTRRSTTTRSVRVVKVCTACTGTVLPSQSWLTGKGLGNMLRTPWPRIWHSGACRAIRGESAKMERRCQLGATQMQEGC